MNRWTGRIAGCCKCGLGQILEGQRFFDGTIWVDKSGYNIVRMQGQAVPQIRSLKQENLFPHDPLAGGLFDACYQFNGSAESDRGVKGRLEIDSNPVKSGIP